MLPSAFWGLVLCFVPLLFIIAGCGEPPPATKQRNVSSVTFDQDLIDGVYSGLDLDDEVAVFEYMFSSLPDSVVIYPTENYYYFNMTAAGKTIWGNFRLDVVDRDLGVIHLGYFEYDENGQFQDRDGWQKAFSKEDGVDVVRLDPFLYSVTYKNRTVRFRLNDVGMSPPTKATLGDFEAFVGNVFDESGLKFFLIYDKPEKHFLFVLNEDGFTPEEFTPVDEDVVTGRRTGFAFYVDRPNNRKILIAVYGKNTDRNNFYDGPFDQLPDNYASLTNISAYIQEAYPYTKGNIDRYGNFADRTEARVVINPYTVYYDTSELSFVASCKSAHPQGAAFYACITPDFIQQSFDTNE